MLCKGLWILRWFTPEIIVLFNQIMAKTELDDKNHYYLLMNFSLYICGIGSLI